MKNPCRRAHRASWILAVVLLPASLLAEPVPLKRVVELALAHASGAAIAAAEVNPKLSIAVVSKVYPMRSHTVSAEGGAAGVAKPDDSLDEHAYDTISGGDWLRRAQRLTPPPVRQVSIVIGDASRDELDRDAPYIRALQLFLIRAGVKVLSCPRAAWPASATRLPSTVRTWSW